MSKTQQQLNLMVEWKTLPWKRFHQHVFKLQNRIYKAEQRGDKKIVRKLQRMLLKSQSARYLAVRKVTQDNAGKKTAGVDGVAFLTPNQRMALVNQLAISDKAAPVRRVRIPKANGKERLLGIPTVRDRSLQALVKLAMESQWEARFEANSYGFRPGRSAQDAIQAIYLALNRKPKYILDADIAQCFDRIDHQALLKKTDAFPKLRRQLKAWIKAGVLDHGIFQKTEKGTPQGGVISPLLANIALHGLETVLTQSFPKTKTVSTHKGKKKDWHWTPSVIRYADDFVVLHPSREVITHCEQIAQEWLTPMGLTLNPAKTRIVHSLHKETNEAGFQFLGFAIRQFPKGKHQCARTKQGKPLGFKTIIQPSKTSIQAHTQQLKRLFRRHRSATQEHLIHQLNPVIRGWANYFRAHSSKKTFSLVDNILFSQIRGWCNFRHSGKSAAWIKRHYWHTVGENHWMFASYRNNQSVWLTRHSEVAIRHHIKVRLSKSPYDGDWTYWATRMGRHPETSLRMATLLKRQNGKCVYCGLTFLKEDRLEIDHILPKSKGGKDSYDNFQLLHRHCHDSKSSPDYEYGVGTTLNRLHVEEPDEGKLSCPVLKTSRSSDGQA